MGIGWAMEIAADLFERGLDWASRPGSRSPEPYLGCLSGEEIDERLSNDS